MAETFSFAPPKRAGVIFHLSAILILFFSSGIGLYTSAYLDLGSNFVFALLLVLVSIPLIPLLLYRLNNLQSAAYILERDIIKLQWGLRTEIIPTNQILWVRPAADLLETLRLPWFRWPGAVIGTRKLSGGIPVEFLASQKHNLILIGTYDRVFAVSPGNPEAFLQSYQRLTELGSLYSSEAESVRPTLLLTTIWQTPLARNLILVGLGFSIVLIIASGMVSATRATISLGFMPNGSPRQPIPGIRLMLLSILNTIIWAFNFFLGLFLFRENRQRPYAYLLWGNSGLVAGLFVAALYFILKIS